MFTSSYCTLCAIVISVRMAGIGVISVRMAGVGVIGYWEKCKCNMSTCNRCMCNKIVY